MDFFLSFKVKFLLFISLFFLTSVNNSFCQTPKFNGQQAFQYLKKQCDFGPRNPGSEGHKKCLDYLCSTLQDFGADVKTQSFLLTFGSPAQTVSANNIIAAFNPQNKQRVLLCAHWDTRPWADMDPNPANKNTPIAGANDGASGVAVLLEIAHILHQNIPPVGIDIVLFDGEDAGQHDKNRSYAQGSAAFAAQMNLITPPYFGILLDMIGDKDLSVYKEAYSQQYAPTIVDQVWKRAQDLGIIEFVPETGYAIFDDHIPLLEAGIPCIDLIDFDYKYWHTVEDTPDKCSDKSLQKVGDLIVSLIYEGL